MDTSERMSGVDRAWLLMDRPANPMVVVGLLILESRLPMPVLRELIEARFLCFPRFRCVPTAESLDASWVESPRFALDDHLFSVSLPARAGQTELESLVGELAGTPMNPERPRWTFHLVERFRGGSALVVRIHHCYADGMALLRVLLSLCNEETADRETASSSEGSHGLSLANLVESGVHWLLHPREASDAARNVLGLAGELARIAVLPDDPKTRLKAPLSGTRRAAWAAPLPLEEFRTLAHLLGCTVNDVLISTLAGALGTYLRGRGDSVAGATIRAAVPVNLRPPSDRPDLGNRFGLVFVELPIGLAHPLERLYAVHDAMKRLKDSPQALVTLGLLSIIGTLPATVEEPAVTLFTAKASLVASNLAGPREALSLAGRTLERMLFWVPQAGSIGTGVSMLTYRGEVHFGVISDREMVTSPRDLVDEVGAEFERLAILVLLGFGLQQASPSEP